VTENCVFPGEKESMSSDSASRRIERIVSHFSAATVSGGNNNNVNILELERKRATFSAREMTYFLGY
jgi:hypothetical protein